MKTLKTISAILTFISVTWLSYFIFGHVLSQLTSLLASLLVAVGNHAISFKKG